MELMTNWERKGRLEGRAEGRQEGQLELVKLLLKRRFGVLSPAVVKQLKALRTGDLARLAEALLDFKSLVDLARWLRSTQSANGR